ncbi:peptidase inhibitor family I36 protein [Actinacidiphila glaucinigra]|uniref:peptidase inhibitor family I36 protein n=1 Tax=Actinacidiphila glaucinigra TaxID=235986 RepID=UPI0035E0C086
MMSFRRRNWLRRLIVVGAAASATILGVTTPASATDIPNLHIHDGVGSCSENKFCGWRDKDYQDGTSLNWSDLTTSLWSMGTYSSIDDFAKVRLAREAAGWHTFNDRMTSYVNNTGQNACLYTDATYRGNSLLVRAWQQVSFIPNYNDQISSLKFVGSSTSC